MALDACVICRVANLADKDAVFAINKQVYSGLDYFPDRYEATINDPYCYCYVLEKDDEIIGFAGHRVLVNDRATVAGNMRLRQEHQGKGFIKYLDQYILKKVQQDHPSIETYRYVTIDKELAKKRTEDPTSGYKLVAHMIHYRLDTTTSKMGEKLKEGRSFENQRVVSVKELMTSHVDTEVPLTIGKVFLYSTCWIPASFTWENIAIAAEKHPAYVTLSEGNTCTALSISDLHISDRGYVVNLHFSSQDGATFDCHFRRHLEDIMRKIPPDEARLFFRVLGPLNQKNMKPLLVEYGDIAEEFEVYASEKTLKKNDSV